MERARMLGTEEVVVDGTEGGRSPTGCVGHGWITEGASPLWSPLEATMSWRQLHEAKADTMPSRSFPRGRVGWKPEAYRSTERK